MSLAKVSLVGNVGNVEFKTVGNQETPLLKFSLATTERLPSKEKKTQWYNCQLWGKRAQSLGDYIVKGKQLYVEGALRLNEYDKKDGTRGVSLDVNVGELVFVGGAERKEATGFVDTQEMPF